MAALIDRDRGWEKLKKEFRASRVDPHAKVGILESKGKQPRGDDFTMVALAAAHEFGTTIKSGRSGGMIYLLPPRPFISGTFDSREDALVKITKRLSKGIYNRKTTIKRALEILGTWGHSQVRDFIVKGEVKPDVTPETLRKKTIRGKVGTTTLVDTGRMLNALTYEVIG